MLRIGIDVGGTFTDFVLFNPANGELRYFKTASTPSDPSEAIAGGLASLLAEGGYRSEQVGFLGHGTTVATNMILERKGARTGLLTTKGFRDVLAIGRQTRPALYDYRVRQPESLVPRQLRLEVAGRVLADGSERLPLDTADLTEATHHLRVAGVEAVAICFLHAYRNPEHEQAARAAVEAALPGTYICTSAEVLPEFREYERTSTTVMNAYVGPMMRRYMRRLDGRLKAAGVTVSPLTVHSNGGLLPVSMVEDLPVLTCLSGPAAGVSGAAQVALAAGRPDIVTFDVGGTSTDVSLVVGGQPRVTSQREVGGLPVKAPMLDIHVIGAGGGSIAAVDEAGALRVGPESAGARPGPVAYGLGGTRPTVTDANIVLNRLDPVALLNGKLPIDRSAALAAIEKSIASPLGLTIDEAAHGVLRVAVSAMSRAVRAVSSGEGHDLARFWLCAFGGAGPLLAAEVAEECGLAGVIVPAEPGTMCARGVLLSDLTRDFVRTCLATGDEAGWRLALERFAPILAAAYEWLDQEGVVPGDRSVETRVDVRYVGQSHEIAVPVTIDGDDALGAVLDGFATAYRTTYGHLFEGRAVEIVNCRVRAVGRLARPSLAAPAGVASEGDAATDRRNVYFSDHGWCDTQIYRRSRLPSGQSLAGPAIIEEMSATTVVLPGQRFEIDLHGNILITPVTRR